MKKDLKHRQDILRDPIPDISEAPYGIGKTQNHPVDIADLLYKSIGDPALHVRSQI
jgi:hypothetical protein